MKPPLLISYFAKNRGTTDYVVDYLAASGQEFYYLRHPLPESGIKESELFRYDDKGRAVKIRSFSIPKSFLVKTLKEQLVSFCVVLKLRLSQKVELAISFGSINATAPLVFRLSTIFWGVDYSERRFQSRLLNRVYSFTETLACVGADKVIQATESQMRARVLKHRLDKRKSIVIPNGVNFVSNLPQRRKSGAFSLIYVGSLSKLHGVSLFIKQLTEMRTKIPTCYIFGDGEEMAEMLEWQRKLGKRKIQLFGSVAPEDIEAFVRKSNEVLIGIAPYMSSEAGHTKYGDSLKVKEYVNLGLPYVASDNVIIDQDLRRFGVVYGSYTELHKILTSDINSLQFTYQDKEQCLRQYSWRALLDKHLRPILLQEGAG